jgi:hypothetical protein
VWLEAVAAVDYLTDTHRPRLTLWDALDEAPVVDGRVTRSRDGFPARRAVELPWSDPDPLRSGVEALLTAVPPAESAGATALGDVPTAAMAAWLVAMAEDFTDSHPFGRPRWRGDAIA